MADDTEPLKPGVAKAAALMPGALSTIFESRRHGAGATAAKAALYAHFLDSGRLE
jgi:hypothetical protein